MLPGTYQNGFAPRDGQPRYPSLWRDCVGAWAPCLGPSGLTLFDWSPFKRHGTLTNMTPADDWTISGGRYALDFDGSNDAVAVDRFTLSSDLTVSCFFACSNFAASRILFGDSADGIPLIGFLGTSTTLTVRTTENGLRNFTVPSLSVNTWYSLVITRSGTALRCFLNGAESTSGARTDAGSMVINRIGSYTTASLGWIGQMDDIRLYSRALNPNQCVHLSRRRGIAYEVAEQQFDPGTNRRRRVLIGA